MPLSLRGIFAQLKTIFINLPPLKKIILLSLVGITIIGFIIILFRTGDQDFQVLYSNLAPEDAGAILANLKDQKIPYQISSNGNSILIPGKQLYETRMELASRGFPQGRGVGFEIFDNTKLGMSEFAQNVNYQRALQGELSRTINQFAEVESSRIHIVMASKSLFVEDEEPATASVVLNLHPGRWLTKNQVQGVVHLLSSSISGLNPENVTIVDNHGKMLAGFKDNSTIGKISSDQLVLQEKVERNLENRIKTMLDTALGPGKAIVRLSCILDFKRQEKTEERYYPDNKVVRSEQISSETSNESKTMPAGVPGVRSNLSTNLTGTKTDNKQVFKKQDQTVNYEIGKVTSHTVEPIGKIKKISVAVIVDGTYKYIEGKDGEQELKYFPRTPEEIEKLGNIVKRAVNFDAERGDDVEVANIAFENDKLQEVEEGKIEKKWFSSKEYAPLIKYAFWAIFMLLALIFVIRPLLRWLTSSSIPDMEILKQLPKTVGEIEMEQAGGMQKMLPFRDRVADLIKDDGSASLEVVRDWINSEK